MEQKPAGAAFPLSYHGPKDVGRAESLYRSALDKPDLDYAAQLLFWALAANPEHQGAFRAVLAKIPAFAAKGRRMVVRVPDPAAAPTPADGFLRALALYSATPSAADAALDCAAEAQKAGLTAYAVAMGERVLQQFTGGDPAGAPSSPPKPAALVRLMDLFEACGALDHAAKAARRATQLYPDDQTFREREKNLLAGQYMKRSGLADADSFRRMLHDPRKQEAMHRPADRAASHAARVDELEQRYRQGQKLEDFRELARALRESPAARREAALPVLQDGLDRFGEKETLWFVREIRLERKWAELRAHRQVLADEPGNAQAGREHERLRQEVLREHVDHLYEVVSSLPPSPERHRRQMELANRLFEAGRYEEAVKQAQAAKRRGEGAEGRLDALVVMAKSFVQLGLTPEATECFQAILSELDAAGPHGTSLERALEAKYSFAQFLTDEAERKSDPVLARQARKLCSDVMIEDIDYRQVRKLSARAEAVLRAGAGG